MKSINNTWRGITLSALALIASAGIASATYSYQCPRCGYVSTYSMPSPGAKCPNDGSLVIMR